MTKSRQTSSTPHLVAISSKGAFLQRSSCEDLKAISSPKNSDKDTFMIIKKILAMYCENVKVLVEKSFKLLWMNIVCYWKCKHLHILQSYALHEITHYILMYPKETTKQSIRKLVEFKGIEIIQLKVKILSSDYVPCCFNASHTPRRNACGIWWLLSPVYVH